MLLLVFIINILFLLCVELFHYGIGIFPLCIGIIPLYAHYQFSIRSKSLVFCIEFNIASLISISVSAPTFTEIKSLFS